MGCIGGIIMFVVWASPAVAIVSWIGYIISEPKSGGWLALALIFSIATLILGIVFVRKFRETEGASALDLQMAAALPYEVRGAFLEEAKWKELTSKHVTRGDGVGATFSIQRNSQTGKVRAHFALDVGVEGTPEVLEWGRVTAIKYKAEFDIANGSS